MNLKEFVSKALLDIVDGVADAQSKVTGGVIVPAVVQTFQAVQHGVNNTQAVSFEVTVRAEESVGSEARLNVVAGFFGAGVKGERGNSEGHAAVLSIKVPIRFVETKVAGEAPAQA
jgi:hypothetical protein